MNQAISHIEPYKRNLSANVLKLAMRTEFNGKRVYGSVLRYEGYRLLVKTQLLGLLRTILGRKTGLSDLDVNEITVPLTN